MDSADRLTVSVTFAGCGDAFGSGGRFQACIHLRPDGAPPVLLQCAATSPTALKRCGLDPGEVAAVFCTAITSAGCHSWSSRACSPARRRLGGGSPSG